jgi:hypothetical protein
MILWKVLELMILVTRSHRVVIVRNLGLSGRKSPAMKVLILLVESGTLYCALQVRRDLIRSSQFLSHCL